MITVPEAARRTGRNPETIRRWIREGKLQAQKVGTQHTIEEADLAAILEPGVKTLPLPPAWGRTITGEPMPNVPSLPGGPRWVGTSDLLAMIVGRIVRLVDPMRIVLFGSRAREAARHDSDYDVLVVLDAVSDRREARISIRRALGDLPASIDIVVATPSEFDAARRQPRGIVQWAAEQGRVVYERA
jgi:excisionase family DNA binding protein